MAWWSGVKEQFLDRAEEAETNQESARLTGSDTFSYGRSAEVAPGVGGHVKKPRKPK
jgi:hypothetical protein